MDIRKREKIATRSYSVANVCLRTIGLGCKVLALVFAIGCGASLAGIQGENDEEKLEKLIQKIKRYDKYWFVTWCTENKYYIFKR